MTTEPELRRIKAQSEWDTVVSGEAVICDYPQNCSACIGQGEQKDYPAGQVVLANITRRANVGKPGFWHGWWSCTGPNTQNHWDRGATRARLIETGSVTPR